MGILDWLVVVVPVVMIIVVGILSMRYIQGVSDFLSAGRLCGRYLICVADVANGLSIIGLVSYVEIHYKTGFALTFWQNVIAPITILMGLTGFCFYRFRETKAMSLGQFIEMRYSRSLRIFASGLRSISEMLANMIMPAIAARFFIYFLGLPNFVNIFGIEISTFHLLVVLVLTLAISIICMGGTLALVITDSLQGLICYPLLVIFVIFVLTKFSWSNEIVPVMMDRVEGESFLNPYDISNLRDFNLFYLGVAIFGMIMHRSSWIGAGNSTAARSPHEQKMANMLGTWRGMLGSIFYILIAVTILTVMNHRDFAPKSHEIRTQIAQKISGELAETPELRKKLIDGITAVPVHKHEIGTDTSLSEKHNLDTPYLDSAKATFAETDDGNHKFQEFRTLYHQLMMAITMRNLLPPGMLGLFCLLLVLAMISTDDSRIFSAALTISQDVVLPLRKKPLTPKQHIKLLRVVSIGVGVFFLLGASFMSQLDYIQLFVTIMTTLWLSGCGPVMVFGLYSKFGTAAGAWTSLLTGVFMSLGSIFVQRNWADMVYPVICQIGAKEAVGSFLSTVSSPFNPYILWEMNPYKCPINAYEFYFITMLTTLSLYIVVSLLTCRRPFNLDRMLHRGKYDLDGGKKLNSAWTWSNVYSKLIGITPEYTTGDKVIAWGLFSYSIIYKFGLAFVAVVIWNAFSRWPLPWWGNYFFIVSLLIPATVAGITTVWFGIGGIKDFIQLFRDLRNRTINPLDDGRVEGNMSLADKAQLEAVDSGRAAKK